jgi:hypothetical protein
MVVTEFGIVTANNFVQFSNAPSPMLVTKLGIVIDVKFEHPAKTYGLSIVREFEIVTDDINEQL